MDRKLLRELLGETLSILTSRETGLRDLARRTRFSERSFYIGADLRGVDLSGQDLRGMSFARADLRGAQLTGAMFNEEDLIDTILGPAERESINNKYIHREWTDVYLVPEIARVLQNYPLFFVPDFKEWAEASGLDGTDLRLLSKRYPELEHVHLGKATVKKLIGGQFPVNYEVAVKAVAVTKYLGEINRPGVEPLNSKDIVACVFRLQDKVIDAIPLFLPYFGLIAGEARLTEDLVRSIFGGYRLCYVHAHEIAKVIFKIVRENPSLFEFLSTANTGDELLSASFRWRPFQGVQQVVYPQARKKSLFFSKDVSPAPASGHYWARLYPETPQFERGVEEVEDRFDAPRRGWWQRTFG